MECLKEITKWDDNTPNHSYLLNDGGRLIAFRRTGAKEWQRMSKPKSFSKSRRRFVKLGIPEEFE